MKEEHMPAVIQLSDGTQATYTAGTGWTCQDQDWLTLLTLVPVQHDRYDPNPERTIAAQAAELLSGNLIDFDAGQIDPDVVY